MYQSLGRHWGHPVAHSWVTTLSRRLACLNDGLQSGDEDDVALTDLENFDDSGSDDDGEGEEDGIRWKKANGSAGKTDETAETEMKESGRIGGPCPH